MSAKRIAQVSDGWVEMVEAAMAERGISRLDLARAVNCAASIVTRLLKERKPTRYADDIADYLKLPRPTAAISTREEWEWLHLGQRLHSLDPVVMGRVVDRVRLLVRHAEDRVRLFRELDASTSPTSPTSTKNSESDE